MSFRIILLPFAAIVELILWIMALLYVSVMVVSNYINRWSSVVVVISMEKAKSMPDWCWYLGGDHHKK